MTDRKTPDISSRKQPRQVRSATLVEDILATALQVLAKEGATRFTTARVAEKAGVSVGSLYQYFPNKAAILFRLQTDEWARTTGLLRGILEDRTRTPGQRLRDVAHAFIVSECEEAQMRQALDDAAPFYRDAPEAEGPREAGARTFQVFMDEALPTAPEAARVLAGEMIMMTLGEVGKRISEQPRTPAEIAAYADAMADMFCAYLDRVGAGRAV